MQKKKRILLIVKSVDGGTGTFILSMSKLQEKLGDGYDIQVASLEKPSFRKMGLHNITYLRDCAHYPYFYTFSKRNLLGMMEELKWLSHLIDKKRPHVIIGVDVHCNLLIQISKMVSRTRFSSILTTHIDLEKNISSRADPLTAFLLRWIIGILYSKANLLIFVSNNLKENFIRRFQLKLVKSTTIYNGVVCQKEIIPHTNFSKKILITITRLVDQKDLKTLLFAFKKVLKAVPKAQLFVIGDGIMKKELVMYAKTLRLDKRVHFPGWVTNIKQYLLQSSVFVLSSRREGFNYSLVEAMSYGVPVISTNTPYGPEEILGKGAFGYLVPMGDYTSLARQLTLLLHNKQKYIDMSNLARDRSEFFSEDKMLSKYAAVLKQLCEKNQEVEAS